jgi:hypothetical protein
MLMSGLIFFFVSKIDRKIKSFLVFWLVVGALPAALTRDGGNHATRLFLILPPLIFLISYGIVEALGRVIPPKRFLLFAGYSFLLLVSFIFYQHRYWVHNPWDSERWWHSGFREAIQSIKEVEKDYDRVIISMAGEPAWIFFAGWYEYPPSKWQEEFPIGKNVYIEGFGNVSHIDKFHFGKFNIDGKSIYDLPNYINDKTLYLASASELGPNLVREPKRTPPGLSLIKSISYPSGEPAFYLFSGGN